MTLLERATDERDLLAEQVLVYLCTLNQIRDVVAEHEGRRGWSRDIEAIARVIAEFDAAMFELGMRRAGN